MKNTTLEKSTAECGLNELDFLNIGLTLSMVLGRYTFGAILSAKKSANEAFISPY